MELQRLADLTTNYTLPCRALTRMGNPIKGVMEISSLFLLFDQSEYDLVQAKINQ
jgi:hypothetical protein